MKLSTTCSTQFRAFAQAALVLLGLLALGGAAQAQSACPRPGTLGVSRTIELDTQGGQLYGNGQYTANADLLQDKEVVLTFDDGPMPETTRPIMAALDAECTKATFFVVGRMALAYQTLLRELDASGHTIANHTWSHPFIRKLSAANGQLEIEEGVSMIAAVLGKPQAPFFRFPYLDDPILQIDYLKARDMGIFSIDVDSYDSHGSFYTKERVISQVINSLMAKGKGIVLMHDIKRTTAAALPEILRQLRENGFKIVHLTSKRPVTTLPVRDAAARALIARFDAVLLAERGAPEPVTVAENALEAGASIPPSAIVAGAATVAAVAPGVQEQAAARAANRTAAIIDQPGAMMRPGAAAPASAVLALAAPTDEAGTPVEQANPFDTGAADAVLQARLARQARQLRQERLARLEQQRLSAVADRQQAQDQRATDAERARLAAVKRKADTKVAAIDPVKPKLRIVTGPEKSARRSVSTPSAVKVIKPASNERPRWLR